MAESKSQGEDTRKSRTLCSSMGIIVQRDEITGGIEVGVQEEVELGRGGQLIVRAEAT
jgi:hypothetical protein